MKPSALSRRCGQAALVGSFQQIGQGKAAKCVLLDPMPMQSGSSSDEYITEACACAKGRLAAQIPGLARIYYRLVHMHGQ